mgnify:CR=1 FL=1
MPQNVLVLNHIKGEAIRAAVGNRQAASIIQVRGNYLGSRFQLLVNSAAGAGDCEPRQHAHQRNDNQQLDYSKTAFGFHEFSISYKIFTRKKSIIGRYLCQSNISLDNHIGLQSKD